MGRTLVLTVGLGLLVSAAAALAWIGTRGPVERPSILLITVDTLRADRLGVYGHDRPTSPEIDAFAENAVVFDSAFTHATLSGPAHATMFTSRHTAGHGVLSNAVAFNADHATLAEILRSAGYRTAMFVSHALLSDRYGFDQGFEKSRLYELDSHLHLHEDDEDDEVLDEPPFTDVFDAAVRWLSDPPDEPFFVWLHVQHPHKSYEPPAPFDRMFGEPPSSEHDLHCLDTLDDHEDGRIELSEAEQSFIVSQYDAEIAFVDAQLGRIFDALKRSGGTDRTVVVLTSDHGEMLLDGPRGRESGHSTHREDSVLRVPLVIRDPRTDVRGRRVGSMVGLLDLAPTVLDLVGLNPPLGYQGRSLRPLLEGGDHEIRAQTFSSTFHSNGLARLSVRTRRNKLICDRLKSVQECRLHDLVGDPGELVDVADEPAYAQIASELERSLATWFDSQRENLGEMPVLDNKARKILTRAGYLRKDD